jgi:hypothetical protein
MRQINLVSIMGIGSIVRNTILWLSLGWALLAQLSELIGLVG